MNIKSFLINRIIDDLKCIEELIYIDNKIQCTDINFKQLIMFINNIEMDNFFDTDMKADFIIDGSINVLLKTLINYANNINRLHINRRFIGIASWLVTNINEFYEINIELDLNLDYTNLKNDDILVIVGNDDFITYLSDMFSNKKVIAIDCEE